MYRYTSVLDIEECATETDNCHVDANCTNTKGSFYCTCHTGYSGDGVRCIGMRCSTFMVATTAVAHKSLFPFETKNSNMRIITDYSQYQLQFNTF